MNASGLAGFDVELLSLIFDSKTGLLPIGLEFQLCSDFLCIFTSLRDGVCDMAAGGITMCAPLPRRARASSPTSPRSLVSLYPRIIPGLHESPGAPVSRLRPRSPPQATAYGIAYGNTYGMQRAASCTPIRALTPHCRGASHWLISSSPWLTG